MRIGTRSVLFGAHQFLLHPWFVAAAWAQLYGFPWDPRLWVAFFVHDIGYLGKPNMDGPEGETHPEIGARVIGWLFDRFERPVAQAGCWEVTEGADTKHWYVRWSLPNARGLRCHVRCYPPGGWGQHVARADADAFNARQLTPQHFPVRTPIDVPLELPPGPPRRWHDFVLLHSRYYAKALGRQPSRLCIADKLAIALTPAWLYLPLVRLTGEIDEYMAHAAHQAAGNEQVDAREQAQLTSGAAREWYRGVQSYCRRWADVHRDGAVDTWTAAARRRAVLDADGVWR